MWVVGAVQLLKQPCLAEAKFESAELSGQEVDDGCNIWWWDEDRVDAMDYAVGGEDVDSDEAAVEVDGWALERYAHSKTLLVAEELLRFIQSWDGVAVEHTAGWVEVIRDMVQQDAL